MYFALRQANNKIVDASLQPQISVNTITNAINFTDPRGKAYVVMSTSLNGEFTGSSRVVEQFTLDLHGFVPSITMDLRPVLKYAWQQYTSGMLSLSLAKG